MANCFSSSMGVPPHPPPNHLTTSSSATANHSRITLHSFNSAATQALLLVKKKEKTVVHQGLMGDLAALELDVSLSNCEKKKQTVEIGPQKTLVLDLQKTV